MFCLPLAGVCPRKQGAAEHLLSGREGGRSDDSFGIMPSQRMLKQVQSLQCCSVSPPDYASQLRWRPSLLFALMGKQAGASRPSLRVHHTL